MEAKASALTMHWVCLECDDHGVTNGTESTVTAADVVHVKATGHAVFTTTQPWEVVPSAQED